KPVLMSVLALSLATPAEAWPTAAQSEILLNARGTLPPEMQRLLTEMEAVLLAPCGSSSVDQAAEQAIRMFTDSRGDLNRAVAALREAGCAAAAMNDPGMDSLVEAQSGKFPVVFYGWHTAIRDLDLPSYLEIRQEEIAGLSARFRQSSELPKRSEDVDVSPEFGFASIAYSRAVTDVANVWLYVWMSINGSFD